MRRLLHLIPDQVYIGLGTGVVIVLIVLLVLWLGCKIIDNLHKIPTRYKSLFWHIWYFDIRRRRIPTERIRKVWLQYTKSKDPYHKLVRLIGKRYRLRNIRDTKRVSKLT